MTKLIEKESVRRDYDMIGTNAVIDTVDHGRLLIQDGFGGIDDLCGGAVRWRHGLAVQLQPTDSLELLRSEMINDFTSRFDQVTMGYDKTRPILLWPGFVIESMATAIGL